MAKSKQKINEDILEMGRLMTYNRGLTSSENNVLFENKATKKPLNEVIGALAGPALAALSASLPVVAGSGLGFLWYRTIKNYVTKLGSSKKFNLGMGSVNGGYLFETEPFEVEGIDLLDGDVVTEIVGIFDEAMDGGWTGVGTDEDAIYKGIKMCQTAVGMSQVAATYQAEEGKNLRSKLIGEMKDDKTELNRMFSMAERLPLLSYKGTPINDLKELEEVVAEEKKKDTDTKREGFAVDFDLIKVDEKALPFDYAMSAEAQAKFNEYLDNSGYVKKYTPEFLAAQAIAKTSPVEIEIDYPGDGKIVAVVVEGKISGDGKGNITKSDDVTDVGDDTKDNTTDDKEGGDTKKSSGSSSWKKAPDSEPTEGDKTTFIKKGHYNKNNDSNVKKIQKALGIKEDGLYGNDTKAAVEKYQKENGLTVDGVVGHGTWTKMVGSEGKAAGETVTKAEENELDKVTIEKEKVDPKTLKDQIADLQTAIGSQPTKESCKTLIATAAAGLKRGVRLDDTNSLKQCYNSYNFGIGINSRKVKKGYNIKGKGN
jgi:peptidoglycan hydrolase-like protein with peptidoglycan-binding domain